MIEDTAAALPSGRRRIRSTRGRIALVGAIVLAVVGVLVAIAAFRYLPVIDDARALRSDLQSALEGLGGVGPGIDRAAAVAADEDLASAGSRLDRLGSVLEGDPLVAVLRFLPPTAHNVRAADELVAAGDRLVSAGRSGIVLATAYLDIRERHGAGSDRSPLGNLVELMADSSTTIEAMVADVVDARDGLSRVPEDVMPPLLEARDEALARIERYLPRLEGYAQASRVLPAALGWQGERRYLVLAQDPAELRPSGGFIGTYGIVSFRDGELTESSFHDVYTLDLRPGLPYVEPPLALRNHLLGQFSWRLADANWSPHFPEAAEEALRFYAMESGDEAVDGVIALTTYAVDELITVTGPIDVADFGTTIEAGETTLTALANTRAARPGTEDRKAFLDVLGDELLDAVFAVPAERWTDLADALGSISKRRLAAAWTADESLQRAIVDAGWDGGVRGEPGDYLFVVDANVAPASKLHFVTQRRLDLTVRLDDVGNARHELEITWTNGIEAESGDAAALREIVGERMLGTYVRLLVPERSREIGVSGGSFVRLTAPESIETVASRTAIGNYLMVPPGSATLRYRWLAPYAADTAPDGSGLYRLVVQKQPGFADELLRVRIALPQGAVLLGQSPDLINDGRGLVLEQPFVHDVDVTVRYAR